MYVASFGYHYRVGAFSLSRSSLNQPNDNFFTWRCKTFGVFCRQFFTPFPKPPMNNNYHIFDLLLGFFLFLPWVACNAFIKFYILWKDVLSFCPFLFNRMNWVLCLIIVTVYIKLKVEVMNWILCLIIIDVY